MKNIIVQTDCKKNRYRNMEPITHRGITVPHNELSDGLTKKFNKYQPKALRGAMWHDFCAKTNCIPWKESALGAKEIWKEDGVSYLARHRWYWAIIMYGKVTFRK